MGQTEGHVLCRMPSVGHPEGSELGGHVATERVGGSRPLSDIPDRVQPFEPCECGWSAQSGQGTRSVRSSIARGCLRLSGHRVIDARRRCVPGSQIAPSTSADATSPLLDVTKFFKHARYHPVAHSRDSRRHVFYGHAEREKPRVLNLEFGPKGRRSPASATPTTPPKSSPTSMPGRTRPPKNRC